MFLSRFNFLIGLLQARGDQGHPDHIFYQGQVATFHHFPADRAKDLMQMAGSVAGKAPVKGVTRPPCQKRRRPVMSHRLQGQAWRPSQGS